MIKVIFIAFIVAFSFIAVILAHVLARMLIEHSNTNTEEWMKIHIEAQLYTVISYLIYALLLIWICISLFRKLPMI